MRTFRTQGLTHHNQRKESTAEEVKKLSETDAIRSICLFIINLYFKVWFNAPKATLAPSQDLQLLKTLINYLNIDGEISKVKLSKIINNLWYLNPEQVPFTFFDEILNKQIKIKMAAKLLTSQKISDDFDDENIQEERVVNAKISLKEANSFLDKEVN